MTRAQMPAPIPADEQARLARLRAYAILDTPPEETFDRITRMAATILGTPIALVSLVDESRQWFKSRVGLEAPETPRDVAFCAHTILERGTMIVTDATQDPRFSANPLVSGAPEIRFYAGAPLKSADGHCLGTLCAIDRVPRQLTQTQIRLLEDLAALVMEELELRAAGTLAVREVAELTKAEQDLRDGQALLQMLHAVATAANEAADPGVVIQQALVSVCAFTGWPVGFARLQPPVGVRRDRALTFWHCEAPDYTVLRSALEADGPPDVATRGGTAAATSDIRVVRNVAAALTLPERVRRSGLRGGVTVPVRAGSRLAAVLEFYSETPLADDIGAMSSALWNIAASISRAIERQDVDRMKDAFVATVSHELRTPLTSIKGSLSLIRNGVAGAVDSRLGKMLDIAYDSSDRLVRLVGDLLDVQLIAAGAMSFIWDTVNMPALIDQSLESNRAYCEQRGLTLRVEGVIPDVAVTGDRDRLVQVLTNLLSNASKFSRAGGEIVVAVSVTAERVRLSVCDQGPGIPVEFQGRVFDRFAQADVSDIRSKGGTGLGLNISKSIVEAHRGTIDFLSIEGTGTTFFVDLPLLAMPPGEIPLVA